MSPNILIFSLIFSLSLASLNYSFAAETVEESDTVISEQVEVPPAATALVKNLLDELVQASELPFDQARERGYQLLDKYFGKVLGPDYLMNIVLEKTLPETQYKFDLNRIAHPDTSIGRVEKAMAIAVFRESAWHMLLNVVRSVREIEKDRLKSSSLTMNESLRKRLVAKPLSFSLDKSGKQVVRAKNQVSDYFVKVKLIPEVDHLGESVDVIYVVRRAPQGNFYLIDFDFSPGISSMAMQFSLMRKLILNTIHSGDVFSDFIFAERTVQAMQNWQIDEKKWKELALGLAE